MLRIGSHVSMKAPKMLLGSAEEAASYGANTFMIYTGAPQNTKRKPIDELNIPAGKAFMEAHDLSQIVVHAPYIVNLGNTTKPGYFDFATEFLAHEIERAEAVGATQLTLHPGAHVGAGAPAAIAQIVKGLNEVIRPDQKIQIALETMAGKGTEVGRTFEELAAMIDGVTYNEKLSVTFDTCHTSDAGYAIKDDFDGVLNEFDHVIGLDRLKVVHLNDSKNPQGAHKDRHTNLGLGTIGFDTLNYVAHHPQLADISKILETPYIGEDKKHQFAPYRYELAMLKAGKFNPNLVADVENQ
ncbi:deoxyribonuclease IV [Lactiplantibacillus mudanjiangensis]|uniref:Probable endonuclease 4 n=1 Tax=Lactiplantibacillus mudanjiangensis TaxID=1296538 RepID=A0A660ED30_9LACO|nr:deoxyribonuclease IV [Lactiplantibacillus mudanjiangensis]VDG20538.1 deoxyribonuclease IV [Lactobacillus sp.] [Lactiplantibacillus mudanjiangensis]VDG25995.1 deoxyribonuclease IV [Lactobacillus sp.] [Lactiplantibacillus mudanjiangensis]VDG30501.1 deoxyribonuclease IV [Lactobacillus sp.] [Lactiplantibacillus mudanjiangensis]VDG30724.1 deoxyribonuclease IV [Lactobacillus sp.] [Lactiplantibacillus mudanjiangensis]